MFLVKWVTNLSAGDVGTLALSILLHSLWNLCSLCTEPETEEEKWRKESCSFRFSVLKWHTLLPPKNQSYDLTLVPGFGSIAPARASLPSSNSVPWKRGHESSGGHQPLGFTNRTFCSLLGLTLVTFAYLLEQRIELEDIFVKEAEWYLTLNGEALNHHSLKYFHQNIVHQSTKY